MDKEEIKIHDIKPLVEINDYSFLYFSIVAVVVSIIVLGGLYLLYSFLKHRKKSNIRKEHLHILNSVNLKDTKKAAYMLTKYGATFKDDDSRHQEMYKNMLDKLSKYKYKKDVESFDNETISVINLYREISDV
jgi:hypothetical protein